MGSEEGGLLARASSIAFKQVASWEVQGEGFFTEAWHAMRGHVSTLHATALGEDVIDQQVVSDGEVTDGGKSDGARSDRSARSGTGKGKKTGSQGRQPPRPPPKSWRAREMQPQHKRQLWGAPFVSLGHRALCP